MYIVLNSNYLYKILKIKNIANSYKCFEKAYVFGSILDYRKCPNDIDIVIIYSNYSSELKRNIDNFKKEVRLLMNLPVDVIALSISEENEVNFIKRLKFKYIKLK